MCAVSTQVNPLCVYPWINLEATDDEQVLVHGSRCKHLYESIIQPIHDCLCTLYKRCVQWTCSSLRRGGRLLSSNQSGRSLVNDLRRHKPISTPRILITEFPWIYKQSAANKAEDCSLALPMSTAKTTSLHRCSSSKFSEKEPLPHTNIKLFHRNHTTSQFSQVFWILLFRAFWPLPIFTSLNFGRHKKKFGFWILDFHKMEPERQDCQP